MHLNEKIFILKHFGQKNKNKINYYQFVFNIYVERQFIYIEMKENKFILNSRLNVMHIAYPLSSLGLKLTFRENHSVTLASNTSS